MLQIQYRVFSTMTVAADEDFTFGLCQEDFTVTTKRAQDEFNAVLANAAADGWLPFGQFSHIVRNEGQFYSVLMSRAEDPNKTELLTG